MKTSIPALIKRTMTAIGLALSTLPGLETASGVFFPSPAC
jgi:hypothetical protein